VIAQYLPYNIGIPIGVFFVCIAMWNLWGLRPEKWPKILPRPSLKKQVLIVLVLATVAIVVVAVSPITRQPQENVSIPEPYQVWQWSHPSPQEIWQEIEGYPPYNQETARQGYEGLSVTWGVTLFDATDSPDGVDVWAIPIGQNRPGVSFTVDVSLYPEVKTMPRGQEFVVKGTIANITTICIKLDDCRLIFD